MLSKQTDDADLLAAISAELDAVRQLQASVVQLLTQYQADLVSNSTSSDEGDGGETDGAAQPQAPAEVMIDNQIVRFDLAEATLNRGTAEVASSRQRFESAHQHVEQLLRGSPNLSEDEGLAAILQQRTSTIRQAIDAVQAATTRMDECKFRFFDQLSGANADRARVNAYRR